MKKKDSANTVWKTTVTEITVEKNGKSEMKMSMFLPNTYQN